MGKGVLAFMASKMTSGKKRLPNLTSPDDCGLPAIRLKKIFFIGVELIHNVVLVSGVQQRKLVGFFFLFSFAAQLAGS